MQIGGLVEDIRKMKANNKRLLEDNAKLKFDLDNLELVKFPILAAKLDKVKGKAKTRKAELGDLDSKIRVAERTILNLKEDNEHVAEVKKTLETKVNDLVDALEKEDTSKKEIEAKMQELEETLAKKESEYQQSLMNKDKEWEELNKKWEEISKLYEQNNEIICKNKLDIDQLQKKLEEEINKSGANTELAKNLQEQIDQKNAEITKERETIDKLQSDIQELQSADKDREELIRMMTSDKEQIEIQKEDLKRTTQDLEVKLKNIGESLKKKDNESNKKISELETQLKETKESLKDQSDLLCYLEIYRQSRWLSVSFLHWSNTTIFKKNRFISFLKQHGNKNLFALELSEQWYRGSRTVDLTDMTIQNFSLHHGLGLSQENREEYNIFFKLPREPKYASWERKPGILGEVIENIVNAKQSYNVFFTYAKREDGKPTRAFDASYSNGICKITRR